MVGAAAAGSRPGQRNIVFTIRPGCPSQLRPVVSVCVDGSQEDSPQSAFVSLLSRASFL